VGKEAVEQAARPVGAERAPWEGPLPGVYARCPRWEGRHFSKRGRPTGEINRKGGGGAGKRGEEGSAAGAVGLRGGGEREGVGRVRGGWRREDRVEG